MTSTIWPILATTVGSFFLLSLHQAALSAPGQPASPSPGVDLNCDVKSNAKMDALLARYMVIGRHGRLYPENPQQLKRFCKYVRTLLTFNF